jgi:hypothetical protein
VDQRKSCSKPACPNQYGQQPNPYGNQYGTSGYSNQNVLQKLLGTNYQQPNYGTSQNTGYGNNAYGSTNTGYGSANTGFGSTNTGFGSTNTGYGSTNTGYGATNNFTPYGGGNFYQQAQEDPWAAVLRGFTG